LLALFLFPQALANIIKAAIRGNVSFLMWGITGFSSRGTRNGHAPKECVMKASRMKLSQI
jgi:hypothetical protein